MVSNDVRFECKVVVITLQIHQFNVCKYVELRN